MKMLGLNKLIVRPYICRRGNEIFFIRVQKSLDDAGSCATESVGEENKTFFLREQISLSSRRGVHARMLDFKG